ncbi:MAG: YwaF family protein [Anaerolineaceae bacterium]|nr:YwaF family protein [Anaerolineaceae bacterium]
MAIILWMDEAAWYIWRIAFGTWNIREGLPLHACSLLIWLAGLMLIKKDKRIYEFAYFVGIGGAVQALLTLDMVSTAFRTSVFSKHSFPTDYLSLQQYI